MPSCVVAILDSIICYGLSIWLQDNIIGFIMILLINSIALILIIAVFGMKSTERNLCCSVVLKIIRFNNKNDKTSMFI